VKSVKSTLLLSFSILLGGYYFILQPLELRLNEQKEQKEELERELKKFSTKKGLKRLKELKLQQEKIKEEITILQTSQKEILKRLEANKTLFFTKKRFSKMLDHLLKNSRQLELKSVEIVEGEKKEIGKLYKFDEIKVEGRGEFLKTINFLREVEKSKILLKTTYFKVEKNGSVPAFRFNISFFGVKL